MTAPRWLLPFPRWLALAFVLGFVPAAHANMGAPTDPGQTHGPLVLRNVSEVRVDHEELAFEVESSLKRAQVRATYHLTNGLDRDTEIDLAFVRIHGVEEIDPAGKDVQITVDGVATSFAVLTEADEKPLRIEPPDNRPITWLVFRVSFAPRSSRTVRVSYLHLATEDRQAGVNEVYGYDYLLSPAKSWSSFGPIHVSIAVPAGAVLRSSTAFQRQGSRYAARLPVPPKGELGFTVMSLSKVVLGMEDPNAYWALLVLLTSALVIALSVLAGRVWARVRWRVLRAALHAIVSPCLAFGASVSMWLLALKTLPRFALGPNYNPMFGLVFMSIAMVLASIVLSARASGAALRRPRGARDPSG